MCKNGRAYYKKLNANQPVIALLSKAYIFLYPLTWFYIYTGPFTERGGIPVGRRMSTTKNRGQIKGKKRSKPLAETLPVGVQDEEEVLLQKLCEEYGIGLEPPKDQDHESWRDTFSYRGELPPPSSVSGMSCDEYGCQKIKECSTDHAENRP